MNSFWVSVRLVMSLMICENFVHTSKECRNLNISGGTVRYASRMKHARFTCDAGLQLVGKDLLICHNGNWTDPVPVCLGKSCPRLSPDNGVRAEIVLDGMATQFYCPGGYLLDGSEVTNCNGTSWDKEPPKCKAGTSNGCDFEAGFCDWVNDYSDDLNWIRHKGTTPTAWTGPEVDHTSNSKQGYYVFTESTVVKNAGKTARFLSPYFLPDVSEKCLEFFYHMYGENASDSVGQLEVLVRPLGSEVNTSHRLFAKSGDKGNSWNRAYFGLPKQEKDFQIIFQVTLTGSGLSDIALDDINMANCSEVVTLATTELTKSVPIEALTHPLTTDLVEEETLNNSVRIAVSTTTTRNDEALATALVSPDSNSPVHETAANTSQTTETVTNTSPARNALDHAKTFYYWAQNPILAGVALVVVVSALALAVVKYQSSNRTVPVEARQPKDAELQAPSTVVSVQEGPLNAGKKVKSMASISTL